MQLVQPSIIENMRGQLSFTLSKVTVSFARGCHGKCLLLQAAACRLTEVPFVGG